MFDFKNMKNSNYCSRLIFLYWFIILSIFICTIHCDDNNKNIETIQSYCKITVTRNELLNIIERIRDLTEDDNNNNNNNNASLYEKLKNGYEFVIKIFSGLLFGSNSNNSNNSDSIKECFLFDDDDDDDDVVSIQPIITFGMEQRDLIFPLADAIGYTLISDFINFVKSMLDENRGKEICKNIPEMGSSFSEFFYNIFKKVSCYVYEIMTELHKNTKLSKDNELFQYTNSSRRAFIPNPMISEQISKLGLPNEKLLKSIRNYSFKDSLSKLITNNPELDLDRFRTLRDELT